MRSMAYGIALVAPYWYTALPRKAFAGGYFYGSDFKSKATRFEKFIAALNFFSAQVVF
ncbi:MAG: hypothetical protein JSR33_04950 [Proteobacteria bacterium]|nr:hypothetical protein [Pseudomonadota bacterium]